MSFVLNGAIKDIDDPRDHDVDMAKMNMDMADLTGSFDVTVNPPTGLDKPYELKHCYNQLQVNSCTSNAIALAYRFELQRQQAADSSFKPSRLFLHYVARYAEDNATPQDKSPEGVVKAEFYERLANSPPTTPEMVDKGAMPRDVIKIVTSLGVPQEAANATDIVSTPSSWPYDENFVSLVPNFQAFQAATLHKGLNYARPHLDPSMSDHSINCWKGCIKSGYPVVFAFLTFPSLATKGYDPRQDPFVLSLPLETSAAQATGGHCVVAIGWNDSVSTGNGVTEGCFLIQNSWGEIGLDGKGRFWLPYTWFGRDGYLYSPWTFMKGVSK
ncbi:unnamed protein product [Clonostachys rhizophaga]|uniref:Peptidase C1A papain C-terminal domain-containing protein n=1 Tax=Clonostachys rhizophaga TaxID=160324 RepID=A0A9N9YCW9_9HYPO|nr:unnamed protein product [Clonostachys rhizophaga]